MFGDDPHSCVCFRGNWWWKLQTKANKGCSKVPKKSNRKKIVLSRYHLEKQQPTDFCFFFSPISCPKFPFRLLLSFMYSLRILLSISFRSATLLIVSLNIFRHFFQFQTIAAPFFAARLYRRHNEGILARNYQPSMAQTLLATVDFASWHTEDFNLIKENRRLLWSPRANLFCEAFVFDWNWKLKAQLQMTNLQKRFLSLCFSRPSCLWTISFECIQEMCQSPISSKNEK